MSVPFCKQCGRKCKYLWKRGGLMLCSRCARARGMRIALPGDSAVRRRKTVCDRCEKPAARLAQCGRRMVCKPCMFDLGLRGRERAALPCVQG